MESKTNFYVCDGKFQNNFTTLNSKPISLKNGTNIKWHIALLSPRYGKFEQINAVEKAVNNWQRAFDLIKPVGRVINLVSTKHFDEADIKIFFVPKVHSEIKMAY